MANRIEATLGGMGSPTAVKAAIHADLIDSGLQAVFAEWCKATHSAQTQDNKLDRRFLAIVASYLNEDFTKTGRLWRADVDGRLEYDYISGDKSQAAIASLMAD